MAEVSLSGNFSNAFLPLADTLLQFDEVCHESCVFPSIPAASYQIILTSTGMTTVRDEFSLKSGEKITKTYTLEPNVELSLPQNLLSLPTEDDLILLETDLRRDLGDGYGLIGVDFSGGDDLADSAGGDRTRAAQAPGRGRQVEGGAWPGASCGTGRSGRTTRSASA